MKRYFTTGLAILLPIILTGLIVGFLINILTKPFLGITERLIHHFLPLSYSFLHPDVILFLSKLFILFSLIFIVGLVGFIGRLFLIDWLFRLGDHLFHNLPLINKIYKATQDVVHSLLSSSSKSFSQVVLVPFPFSQTLSVGLVTKDSLIINAADHSKDLVPVFIPGTPNPSVGFLIMFKRSQLMLASMKIDEAMKFVVSCGVASPNFSVRPPVSTDLMESPYETPNQAN